MTAVDVAQGFVIAVNVKQRLAVIDANTAVQLAAAADDQQRKAILAERDRRVAELLGGAVIEGSFLLVSLGAGIKQTMAKAAEGAASAAAVKSGRGETSTGAEAHESDSTTASTTATGASQPTPPGAVAFVPAVGVQGTARQAAEEFDSAVSHHHSEAGVLPKHAAEEIMARLPEAGIDASDPVPGIRRYLARELGLQAGALEISPIGGGLSGAHVFSVRHHGELLGIFKIFRDHNEMLRELSSLKRLADLELQSMKPVGITAPARHGNTGAAFMQPAQGDFVSTGISRVSAASGNAREVEMGRLCRNIDRVARAIAELHDAAASGALVSDSMKQSEIHWLRMRWEAISKQTPNGRAAPAVPENLSSSIGARLDLICDEFADARIPATMAHGDAHGGNFSVAPDGRVNVIDVETMWRSVDPSGHGIAPAATDTGRFFEWLMIEALRRGLTISEAGQIQRAFADAYHASSHMAAANAKGAAAAQRFYQVNFDTIVLRTEISKSGTAFDPAKSPALQQLLKNLEIAP